MVDVAGGAAKSWDKTRLKISKDLSPIDMRGKRTKAQKKQMEYLHLNFKFREPYQVMVDEEIILEAVKTKYDLVKGLERTLQGQVKPMITQCTINDLYKTKNAEAIELAKSFERRRCGHAKVEELLKREAEAKAKAAEKDTEDAETNDTNDTKQTKEQGKTDSKLQEKPRKLITNAFDCMASVVIQNSENKHRYVVATQKIRLRQLFRTIPAIPLIYLSRSVMIMEPMSRATELKRLVMEDAKLQGADVAALRKRAQAQAETEEEPAKKKRKGPRGPNPLSVKKKKPTQSKEQPKDGEKRKRRHRRSATTNAATSADAISSTAS